MKINIIGGTGVVGNGISQILKLKHDVSIFDSKCFDVPTLRYLDDIFNCDCLIHAGGVTDEEVYENFDKALHRATISTNYLIEGCLKNGCKKFVYISTVHVYGNLMGLLSSKSLPKPKSNYSLFHLFTEGLFKKLDNSCSVDTLILRIPTIYGYPLHKSKINRALLIPYDFPNQLIEKGVINLNTAGLQKRNFCSNLKLGLIVSNWLKGDCSVISNVNGEITMSVRDFALDCISIYHNLTGIMGKLVCNQINLQQTIDDFEIETTIDVKEPLKLTDFIEDYIKLKIH